MEPFNKYDLPLEIERLGDLVQKYGSVMADKKSRAKKLDNILKETQKNQKNELVILYGKLYCEMKRSDPKLSDTHLKHLVVADDRYSQELKKQNKKIRVIIDKQAESIQEEEKSITDYFSACQRRSLIESAVKLTLSGFIGVSEEKINREIEKEKNRN